jgi:hypothetical protein
LREAAEKEREVLKYWDVIKFTEFSTGADKKDRLVQEDHLEVNCRVDFGNAPVELFRVELFHLRAKSDRFKVIDMARQDGEGPVVRYGCSFRIEDYGLQTINARIRPADDVVGDLHPELIKWAE